MEQFGSYHGPIAYDIPPAMRRFLAITEARRWVGVSEQGGNNRGQFVGILQRFSKIDPGDAWCMAFVQFVMAHVDANIARMFNPTTALRRMATGAHCMTVWRETPAELRSQVATIGSVVIWNHAGSDAGHTGIVTAVEDKAAGFTSIEGNTAPAVGVQRDGDGIYEKPHGLGNSGSMKLVGFISPWGIA